jgi:hypothetical protein
MMYQQPVDLVAAAWAAARLRHVFPVLLDPQASEMVAAAAG